MGKSGRASSVVRGLGAALLSALLQIGCTPAPRQFLSPSDLMDFVTNRTLQVHASPEKPDDTLLFLASDGSGWLNNHVGVGLPPDPHAMSIVLDWWLTEDSRVCVWATPTIGDMPSFVPIRQQCIQVLHPAYPPPDGLLGVVLEEHRSSTGWLDAYPFNAFPQPVIDRYYEQVRVLYGGRLPSWTMVKALHAPQYRLQLSGAN